MLFCSSSTAELARLSGKVLKQVLVSRIRQKVEGEEREETGRPRPPCLLMGGRLNLAILAQLGIEANSSQQAGEGQQCPDGGGGAGARVPSIKPISRLPKSAMQPPALA